MTGNPIPTGASCSTASTGATARRYRSPGRAWTWRGSGALSGRTPKTGGRPEILANLKSLLETGDVLHPEA